MLVDFISLPQIIMSLPSPSPSESLKPSEVEAKTMQGASLMVLRTLVLYPVGFIGEGDRKSVV